MQTREVKIFVYEYASIDDLTEVDRQLVIAAREAAQKAYAPYSGFQVGAALLLKDGQLVVGNNQENAAFPSGLCAERVALFYANATFPDAAVEAIAVTAVKHHNTIEEPVKPCGSCRQVMLETEVRFKKPIRIILDGSRKVEVFEGVSNLLPFAFKPDLPD